MIQRERFGKELVPERIVLAVEFDHRLVQQGKRIGRMREWRNRRDRVEGRGHCNPGSPDMRNGGYAVALRERQDIEPTRESAGDGEVGLGDVDAAAADQIA